MKMRHRVIIGLFIIGIALSIVVQGVIIPKNNEKNQKYITEQQNPTSNDLNNIMKYKNKYMGNISNLSHLFYNLPLSNLSMTFELFPDKLTAQINYKCSIESVGENKVDKALIYNSTAAFALIDNLQAINYNFSNGTYKVSRPDIEKWYGSDLSGLLKKAEWKSEVQDKFNEEEYVANAAEALLKK